MTYTSTLTVTSAHTAAAMGSGDLPVLATPALVALMENASMLLCRSLCAEDETTVGGSIQVEHLKPSPVGAVVAATATLVEQEGRKMTLTIEAMQGDTLVGRATHTRFQVNSERFLSKLS